MFERSIEMLTAFGRHRGEWNERARFVCNFSVAWFDVSFKAASQWAVLTLLRAHFTSLKSTRGLWTGAARLFFSDG